MKVELVSGHRYMWPTSNAQGARWVNGLFTGKYEDNCAILMTKNGEKWKVPVEECQPMPKR